MARIEIQAEVNLTEDSSKVKTAILNIFPDAIINEEGAMLMAEAYNLERLSELMEKQRIRDAARQVLRLGREGQSMKFHLNKQAAYMKKVNFAPPSPMGPIIVAIENDNIEEVIEYLTKKTDKENLKPPVYTKD